jgi:hypothetical protein
MKPGWQTSEWWATVVAQVFAMLTVFHVIAPQDAVALQEAALKGVLAVFTLIANAVVVIHYVQSRTHLKSVQTSGINPEARGPGVKVPVLFLAVLLTGVATSPAPAAVLPWRQQVEDRLRQLEQHPQAPAPQGQPPVIIQHHYYGTPPKQDLPIEGAPKQQLPIEGKPKQELPIPGAPRQDLPVPGAPRQDLPGPGAPKQDLPGAGPPMQKLAGPTRYTRYALYRRN